MNNTILDNLADSFIQQCMSRVMEQSYDKEKYIAAAVEIENSILEKVQYDEDYYYTNTIRDIWFIQDSWWEVYDELNHEDQQYVLNCIKDIFPDTWRP
jgi:hypothetical protein